MSLARRSLLPTLFVGLALGACEREPAAPAAAAPAADPEIVAAHAHMGSNGVNYGRDVQQWLGALRGAVASYQRIEVAQAALWPDTITDCMELEGTGGMGFHFGDLRRFDATVDELAPELLVYEPEKNGRMKLVAVEYAIPLGAWTATDPPEIHGVEFHVNEFFGLWVLHAWVGEHNPTGIFKDWNPRVSCQYAPVDN